MGGNPTRPKDGSWETRVATKLCCWLVLRANPPGGVMGRAAVALPGFTQSKTYKKLFVDGHQGFSSSSGIYIWREARLLKRDRWEKTEERYNLPKDWEVVKLLVRQVYMCKHKWLQPHEGEQAMAMLDSWEPGPPTSFNFFSPLWSLLMRIAFEYLCLDCLFGRSHSCSCSCWSDKQSELLSPRDLKVPILKYLFFFFPQKKA